MRLNTRVHCVNSELFATNPESALDALLIRIRGHAVGAGELGTAEHLASMFSCNIRAKSAIAEKWYPNRHCWYSRLVALEMV